MKKVIRASIFGDDDGIYVPHILYRDGSYMMEQVKQRILDKWGKRYKGLQIDIDDLNVQNNRVEADVIIYNSKGQKLTDGHFTFAAYDDYFDDQDFSSHMARTIQQFVNQIITK